MTGTRMIDIVRECRDLIILEREECLPVVLEKLELVLQEFGRIDGIFLNIMEKKRQSICDDCSGDWACEDCVHGMWVPNE